MPKTFRDWLQEGEELYNGTLQEYQAIEAQLEELEKQLAVKRDELNQFSQLLDKPPVEARRRLFAQVVEEHSASSIPSSSQTIAKALAGRGLSK